MRTWMLLLCAIIGEVAATLSLKAALDRPPFYAVVVIGYIGAFGFLSLVLRRGMALGVAYGIWGATGVAATAVLSAHLYDEPMSGAMACGLALIAIGVLVVELGSHTANDPAKESQ
ncbi:DMT family transporter [Rhodococcus sp. SJ-2]